MVLPNMLFIGMAAQHKMEREDYVFAMNGQTGKFVGDLPLDKKAYQRNFAILGGIFSIVASVLAFLADYMFF